MLRGGARGETSCRAGIACRLLALTVVAVGTIGCTSDHGEPMSVSGNGSGRVPAESLRDWVSYADAVVIGRVERDIVSPPTKEEVEIGEGLIGRDVVVDVEQVLWARPQGERPPSSLTFTTFGWVYKKDRTTPMVVEGTDRLAVGRSYLIPIALFPDLGWSPIDAATTVPFEGGRTQVPKGDGAQIPAFRDVDGRTGAEITRVIRAAEPYPAAIANAALDPDARLRAVREQEGR